MGAVITLSPSVVSLIIPAFLGKQPNAAHVCKYLQILQLRKRLFQFSLDTWLIFLLVSPDFISLTVFSLFPIGRVLSSWAEQLPSQETFLQPAVAVSSNTLVL